jgi:ribokinase
MKKICVIGSINMDLTAAVKKFPKAGETVTGISFKTYPGGKGANQAVAVGKLGGDVMMFGKIGDDAYGKQYIEEFSSNNVRMHGVSIEKGISTGIAVIEVEGSGENKIVVISGANEYVDTKYIDSRYEEICQNDIFLFQLEIPLETVIYVMKRLKAENKTIILDPAPAVLLPEEIYKYIDYITPNETELEILSGMAVKNHTEIKSAAQRLLKKGAKNVIVKAGKEGSFIVDNSNFIHMPGFKVATIDTTAAGDTFNAGFAFALSNENDIKYSVRFANACAALSTTSFGAQSAMPIMEEVNNIL